MSATYGYDHEELPPPLSKEAERELLADFAKYGEEHVRNKLVEHNIRLVIYIARKFENTGLDPKDLASVGTIGLVKAINTFKHDKKIKLATYASRCIENEILMYLRRNTRHSGITSLETPLSVDWEGNELKLEDILPSENALWGESRENRVDHVDDVELAQTIMADMKEVLPEREFKIFLNMIACPDTKLNQKQMADELGLSQSYVSRIEMGIRTYIREKYGADYEPREDLHYKGAQQGKKTKATTTAKAPNSVSPSISTEHSQGSGLLPRFTLFNSTDEINAGGTHAPVEEQDSTKHSDPTEVMTASGEEIVLEDLPFQDLPRVSLAEPSTVMTEYASTVYEQIMESLHSTLSEQDMQILFTTISTDEPYIDEYLRLMPDTKLSLSAIKSNAWKIVGDLNKIYGENVLDLLRTSYRTQQQAKMEHDYSTFYANDAKAEVSN